MRLLEEIDRWAEIYPDRICCSWREKKLTYLELKEKSDALSGWIDRVYGDDTMPVIVHGHMDPDMLVLFLACAKSGHAYIPLDLSLPEERISMIAEDSQAELVFSERPDLLPVLSGEVISFSRMDELAADDQNQSTRHARQVSGMDTFYIIYTSGSTGKPKGVPIPYESLASFVSWMDHDFGLENQQVFMNQAPYSFDLSVMALYPCLTMGGTLWAIDKDMISSPGELLDSFGNSKMNVWVSTPSFAEICMMMPEFSEKLLPHLKKFLFCGETLPVQVADKLYQLFPDSEVVNTYGPTESTVAVTHIQIEKDMLTSGRPLPVGYSKPDCRIRILDQQGNPVPDGETGEIIISGPSVGKGYMNNPEKTAAAFRIVKGQRTYRTGDLGVLKDGLLYYHGRMDTQIKIHGFRMELGEIEHILSSCRYVQQAAVIPVKKGESYDYLMGIVVAGTHRFEKSYKLSAAIRKEMSRYLPAYMLPRKLIYQDSLPLTTNGKIDRKALLKEAVR